MSTAVRSAFKRIGTEYGAPAGAPGRSQGPYGQGPTSYLAPPRLFSANRAFDKLIALCLLAVVSAAVGYAVVPSGLAFACMALAFVIVLVSWFRLGWARVLAPVYAVLEGVALGSVSGAYASFGNGIVPEAVVFTAAVFVGALVLYRTGLVRVTPRMMSLAFMGALGIVAVGVLSFVGLSVPGVDSFGTAGLIFGVLALGIAVLNLFSDFAYVTNAEASGMSSDAEWPIVFAMMTALVLVYISMLRILASAAGGRRS